MLKKSAIVFGVVFLVAVLGFVMGDQPLLEVISNILADAWLHAGIAAVSLYLGFGVTETVVAERRTDG